MLVLTLSILGRLVQLLDVVSDTLEALRLHSVTLLDLHVGQLQNLLNNKMPHLKHLSFIVRVFIK